MDTWLFKKFQLQKGSAHSIFHQLEVESLVETEMLKKIYCKARATYERFNKNPKWIQKKKKPK